jgi:hypothetical protein
VLLLGWQDGGDADGSTRMTTMWHDLDPTIRDWCYAREMLRRLGFTPDELFFAFQAAGKIVENGVERFFTKPTVFLRLATDGKEFTWTIGPVEIPADKVEEQYRRACDLWNEGLPVRLFFASRPFAVRWQLLEALAAKGIIMRTHPQDWN